MKRTYRYKNKFYHFDFDDISAITPVPDGYHIYMRHNHVANASTYTANGGVKVPLPVGEALIEDMDIPITDLQ